MTRRPYNLQASNIMQSPWWTQIVYRYQVQDPCFYSPDSVYNTRCKESQLFSTLLRSLSETYFREEKTNVQQSWPIREKVKRENRCSTELTNQEKVKCVTYLVNYLTQQEVIFLRQGSHLQGLIFCHHTSRLARVRSLYCLHINLDVNVLY